MGLIMKVTLDNVVRLWFGVDTPIRQYKITMNPRLWATCERVSQYFTPPSGALNKENYRKSDKTAFAKEVLEKLLAKENLAEEVYEWA